VLGVATPGRRPVHIRAELSTRAAHRASEQGLDDRPAVFDVAAGTVSSGTSFATVDQRDAALAVPDFGR
jgi:hypothetical protein